MTTITRERLAQYANDPRMCNVNDEIREIARIALAAPTVTFYLDGIEAAAAWVDQQRESYDSEHGRHDPDTGTFEFGNDAQRDYSATLEEIAEGIRGLHPNTAPPAPVVPDGLRLALSNAGIAAPESDETLYATYEKYVQMLVTWVKDRNPFRPAPVVNGEYGDAYQGAREDLSIWKRRALEAEEHVRRLEQINDHLVIEAQGESRMGEPVIREPAPVVPDFDLHRDANRYRFLRDKDAFGEEGVPGLASWDDLAELDMGDFDSAVDARLLSCEIPQHILTEAQGRTETAGVYAELYRLREEIKGPDGFDTWKDAAIAERKSRVELEKAYQRMGDIDYLSAMAAFHSDQWHKMGPITGYMNGWNACRAAMLQGSQPVSNRDELQAIGWLRSDYNSDDKRDPNAPLFMLGRNDPSDAWGVKYIPLTGKSPVIPDGYALVPVEPTPEMLRAGFLAGEDYPGGVYRDMVAAAPQQEGE